MRRTGSGLKRKSTGTDIHIYCSSYSIYTMGWYSVDESIPLQLQGEVT